MPASTEQTRPAAPWMPLAAESDDQTGGEAGEQPTTPTRRRRRSPLAFLAGAGSGLRRVWSNRKWRIVGTVLLVAGLFLGGFVSGWTAHTLTGVASAPETKVQLVPAPPADAAAVSVMPDVRGLALADARQAVVDAGTPVDAITVVQAPSALPAGTVTVQDPLGGAAGTAKVTLTVAEPGTMPKLVGSTATKAAQTLLDLGVRAVQNQVYNPSVAEGTVLAVDPPAGSRLPTEAKLTVAGPASSVFLATLQAVSSACSSGAVAINGHSYPQSLSCSIGSADSDSTQIYLVNRQVTQLTGVLGINDTSDPASAARVRIIGDGRTLFEHTLRYGAGTPLKVSLAGVLRLEIHISGTSQNSGGELGLGDLTAIGSPAGINSLATK